MKLSDSLVLDARIAGEAGERSIAGQVEFWAKLGRSAELLLQGEQVLHLVRKGAARPLSAYMESVDSPEGHARVSAYLASQPYPHYRPHPTKAGLLERVEEDGSRTSGRFANRRFQPTSEAKRSRTADTAHR